MRKRYLKEINWELIEFKEKFVLDLLEMRVDELWVKDSSTKIVEAKRLFFILTERDCRATDLIQWIYNNRGEFIVSEPSVSQYRRSVASNPLFRLLLKMYEELSGEKYYLKALADSRRAVKIPTRKYIKNRL